MVILVFIAMAFILIRQIFELQIIQGENYISEFDKPHHQNPCAEKYKGKYL